MSRLAHIQMLKFLEILALSEAKLIYVFTFEIDPNLIGFDTQYDFTRQEQYSRKLSSQEQWCQHDIFHWYGNQVNNNISNSFMTMQTSGELMLTNNINKKFIVWKQENVLAENSLNWDKLDWNGFSGPNVWNLF